MDTLLLLHFASAFLSRQSPSASGDEKAVFDAVSTLVSEIGPGSILDDGAIIRDALQAVKDAQS